jgi:hypothetical protein
MSSLFLFLHFLFFFRKKKEGKEGKGHINRV